MPDQPAEQRDRLEELTHFLQGEPVGSLRRLPVKPQLQELPFNELSWEAFEQICWKVIELEPGIVGQVALYGQQGDTQEGIDIFSRRVGVGGVEEDWVYQCKNYRYYPPSRLELAIKELKAGADQFVVIFATRANAQHRKIQREHANLEVWDGMDLSQKLKGHPALVADFFGLAWVRPFCEPLAADRWLAENGRVVFQFVGTVFDEGGHGFVNASVRVIAGDDGWVGTTGGEGLFTAELIDPAPEVTIIASHHRDTMTISGVSTFTWDAALAGEAMVHMRPEASLSARVLWLGRREPVDEATVVISLYGADIRRPYLTNGGFRTTLPAGSACDLELTVPGAAVQPMKVVVRPSMELVDLFVARACALPHIQEVVLVQHICDDCALEFCKVPGVQVPEDPAQPAVATYHIGRFPVTCAEYAFYLQHVLHAPKPENWTHPMPPPGREDHPITEIRWHDAQKYCEWLTARTGIVHRLPNRDEWVRAATGNDGRIYPWGDNEEVLALRCNNAEDNINQTTVVKRYPHGRSPYGVWDMVGNVWEWVSDPGATEPPPATPGGEPPIVLDTRLACGGSYLDYRAETNCRSALALRADRRYPEVGFRVLREHTEEI